MNTHTYMYYYWYGAHSPYMLYYYYKAKYFEIPKHPIHNNMWRRTCSNFFFLNVFERRKGIVVCGINVAAKRSHTHICDVEYVLLFSFTLSCVCVWGGYTIRLRDHVDWVVWNLCSPSFDVCDDFERRVLCCVCSALKFECAFVCMRLCSVIIFFW